MSETAKHTPGPWKYRVSADGEDLTVTSEAGRNVIGGCGCCGSPWTDDLCPEANARLIAAAPDLLAALKKLVEQDYNIFTGKGFEMSSLNEAIAAIAKAEASA